jgi:hypothetical protein
MNRSARLLALVCALAVGLCLGGCSPASGKKWEVGNATVSLRENGTLFSYCALHLTRDDRVYMVVAANGCAGSSFNGGEGNFQGELLAKDGGKIGWSCTTHDGQSGKVTIADQEFDLARGGMFLITTKDKSARVEQLVIDAAQLQTCADAKKILGLEKADPRIATFLQSCKAGE